MLVEDCYRLGHIGKAHGNKGQLKAVFDVDNILDYETIESVYILRDGQLAQFHFREFRILSNSEAIIEFKEIADRTMAEALRGSALYLPLDQLPDLEEFQFYYHEIEGFRIKDANYGELGIVKGVIEMPAQDLIAMNYKDKEILIPITDDIVEDIDREAKLLLTNLPDGLLDIYLE